MAPIPVRLQNQTVQSTPAKVEKTQQPRRPMNNICRLDYSSYQSSSTTTHVQSTSPDNLRRSEASTSSAHRSQSRQQQQLTTSSTEGETKDKVISRLKELREKKDTRPSETGRKTHRRRSPSTLPPSPPPPQSREQSPDVPMTSMSPEIDFVP